MDFLGSNSCWEIRFLDGRGFGFPIVAGRMDGKVGLGGGFAALGLKLRETENRTFELAVEGGLVAHEDVGSRGAVWHPAHCVHCADRRRPGFRVLGGDVAICGEFVEAPDAFQAPEVDCDGFHQRGLDW